ncbi:alpha/beta hydrolase [Streptomyces durbertensis]|uniref:Alpha/beta hydrolase n=1 Tax=Streptomyces durbertensis TaxID=2448886 RepID=A0ABR6EN65_9ACTN|nr:alpha/beta hydrolase [Streptomyces durbertensis]MBB1246771.1 alpha/beta hydrolase [Streptomyces durbertensis]
MSTVAVHTVTLREGLSLPYAEAGYPGGVPVVLVHSYADTWWTFEPMLRRFPSSLHGYAPSQRGHGDADRPPDGGYTPHDLAEDLVLFLDRLGLDRVVLVGASSGCVQAGMVAGRYPDRIAGLVLMGSPASLADKPFAGEFREAAARLTDPVDRAYAERFIAGVPVEKVGRGFVETVVGESLKTPAEVWRETMFGLLDTDIDAALAGILVPTLLIWGDQDAFVPRADQDRLLARVFGSRLLVYEGAGHVPYWEAPDRVLRDLTAFATSRPVARAFERD